MVDVSKRPCFEDDSLHIPEFLQIHNVMQAISSPSVENFRSATQTLEAANHDRFIKLQDVAKEQSAGSGESDLRRLKRQFASLKNTFILYDVKETFIDGLIEGSPDGTEENKLSEYEEEAEKHAAAVKKNKQINAEVQAEVEELIEKISSTYQDFGLQKAEIFAQLDSLAQLLQEQDSASNLSLPELPDGPNEATSRALLTHELAQTRSLETALAVQEAEAGELEAAILSEQEEMQSLMSQIEHLQEEQDKVQPGDLSLRAADNLEWCEEMLTVISALSGVSFVCIEDYSLQLRIVTSSQESTGPSKSVSHDLIIQLEKGSCDIFGALLQPATVDIADVLEAVTAGGRPLSFVVREVQSRLDAYLLGMK